MKFIITGIIGLLMIAINLIGFFSRDNTIASASYISGQMTDDSTTSQTGCNHDCGACGKCFSEQSAEITEDISGINTSATLRLIVN